MRKIYSKILIPGKALNKLKNLGELLELKGSSKTKVIQEQTETLILLRIFCSLDYTDGKTTVSLFIAILEKRKKWGFTICQESCQKFSGNDKTASQKQWILQAFGKKWGESKTSNLALPLLPCRRETEDLLKKYLPLSKACKEWLKSPGQAELAERNSDHAHFPEQATYLTAATAFVDIYAYSNKIFCFEAQLVQHPLHKTSGFIHEYASFSWNTEMLNFMKQYYHLGLPLKYPPPTDCTDAFYVIQSFCSFQRNKLQYKIFSSVSCLFFLFLLWIWMSAPD